MEQQRGRRFLWSISEHLNQALQEVMVDIAVLDNK